MKRNFLLGIPIGKYSKNDILEKIKKNIRDRRFFYHIVSLNPENLIEARRFHKFKKVFLEAPIIINDGIGVVVAARLLNIEAAARFTGVELMEKLMEMAGQGRLRVMLIGGRNNLANTIANCYNRRFPEARFFGTDGIKNIRDPQKYEEKRIFSIVTDMKPHIVLVSFGSPFQELWLFRNKDKFKGSVCAGVGGAFDYIGKKAVNPPFFIKKIGFEWLFRLLIQPWRLKRQLKLIDFASLVIKEKWKRK